MTDFALHIREFVPAAEGQELQLRIELLRFRDMAAAVRGRTTSRLAFDLAAEAHERTGEFVFALDVPDRRLELAARLCKRLIAAALAAEALDEAVDA